MRLTSTTIILISSSVLILSQNKAQAIVNGLKAPTNAYSFSAALKRDGEFICSGSIIGKIHVVTAASCIFQGTEVNHIIKPLQVVVGGSNYNDPAAKTIHVLKVQIPKIYLTSRSRPGVKVGDIAVLTLNEVLDLEVPNTAISRLFLPEDDMTYKSVESQFVASGWDSIISRVDLDTNEIIRDGKSSGTVRAVKTTTVSDFECGQAFFDRFNYRYQFCASIVQTPGYSDQGICKGDKGGPLVYDRDTIIGVLTQFDEDCESFGRPELYTKVAAHKNFIMNAKKDQTNREIIAVMVPISYE